MARLPRLTVPGFPHHLIQRGNDRRVIFLDDADRERYLAALSEVAAEGALSLHAYVLMPDHVHLLATPAVGGTIGRAVQAIGRRYVRWFNDRHRRTGALFEGRYRSTVVEPDEYLLACMRYIELNPVRAGLATDAAEFRWSSHGHHVGLLVNPLITDHSVYWALGNTPFERQASYARQFQQAPADAELALIRRATHGGWFMGSMDSVARLTPSRRAVARRSGRPRRAPR